MKRRNYPQGKLLTKISRSDFNKYVLPYLSKGRRGPGTKVSFYKIFNYILFVLHTGCQWNRLPIFRREISSSSIYRHHNRWCKDYSYKNLFESGVQELMLRNKLDLSILHGDGSNTVAKKGVNLSDTADTNTRKV